MRDRPTLLHVDLDAFYASVEQLDDRSLAGRAVVVGGLGPRGVVAAASYEARRYGIHSAQPMSRARRLAPPDAAFLAPRMDRYHELSATVMEILGSVTPLVEPLALDEAFLDVAGARQPHEALVEDLRARVRAETGLTASVGAATTKFLAKLASDLAKPDGALVVEPGTELDLLHPLEVRRLWGVGPATQAKLTPLGIRTVGDLAATDPDTLAAAIGASRAEHLLALAHNRDDRGVVTDREVKSVGHEETFPTDVTDRRHLEHEVARLADRVGSRVRRAGRAGRTVQLKLRYRDFTTITRSRTRPMPTDVSHDIAREARALLDAVDLRDGVRLLGVSLAQLGEPASSSPGDERAGAEHASQPELPLSSERWRDVERSVDAVRARFGPDAVR